MSDKPKNLFTAEKRDQIRKLYDKGKRVIEIDGRKFTMAKGKHGTIVVTPKLRGNDKRFMPVAVLDTKQRMLANDRAMGKSIAQHSKDVKAGVKKPRVNPIKDKRTIKR